MANNGNNHFDIAGGSKTNGQSYTPPANSTAMFFDYPNTTFSGAEINKMNMNDDDDSNKKHIVAQYNNPSSTPNFIMSNTNNYKATKIYITKLIHNVIPGLTEESNALEENGKPVVIGELVVEHEPLSGVSQKLYSCFFLKEDTTGAVNNIDALISMSSDSEQGNSNELHIGKNLPQNNDNTKSSAVSYNSNNNKVVINFLPASINTDSVNIVKDLTYDMSDHFLGTSEDLTKDKTGITDNYIVHGMTSVVNANNVDPTSSENSNNIPSMGPNSDYYLDCNPAGESKDTIATYNIPINSEYTKGATMTQASQTFMNFIVFGVIIGAAYAVIPQIYFLIVYETFIKNAYAGEASNATRKADAVRLFDISLIIILVAFLFIIMWAFEEYGVMAFIYGIFFTGLSCISVINSKMKDGSFINVLNYKDDSLASYGNPFFLTGEWFDIFKFIAQIIFYPTRNYAVLAAVILSLGIYLCYRFDPANVFSNKEDKKQKDTFYGEKFFNNKPMRATLDIFLIWTIPSVFMYITGLGGRNNSKVGVA